jgi:hypothetical protein
MDCKLSVTTLTHWIARTSIIYKWDESYGKPTVAFALHL